MTFLKEMLQDEIKQGERPLLLLSYWTLYIFFLFTHIGTCREYKFKVYMHESSSQSKNLSCMTVH